MIERNRNKRIRPIGELATLAGVTVRTLHQYEELGLIAPAAREEGAYRLYDAVVVEQLYHIRTLRSFGFSLREILAMPHDGEALSMLLREHQAQASAERSRPSILRKNLEHNVHQRLAAQLPRDNTIIVAWTDLRDEPRTCLEADVDPADEALFVPSSWSFMTRPDASVTAAVAVPGPRPLPTPDPCSLTGWVTIYRPNFTQGSRTRSLP